MFGFQEELREGIVWLLGFRARFERFEKERAKGREGTYSLLSQGTGNPDAVSGECYCVETRDVGLAMPSYYI